MGVGLKNPPPFLFHEGLLFGSGIAGLDEVLAGALLEVGTGEEYAIL